jgi:urease accessory protein
MRSDVLIVASPGRSPRMDCRGGIAARLTSADTVHLVSAAATPLGGDQIRVRVVVEAGARLRLRSAAATIALPGADTPQSNIFWMLDVAGDLDVDLPPTIVAGPARHLSSTTLSGTGSSRIRLRERIQIGRSDERQGFWSGAVYADIDGSPWLRHRVELGAGSVADDVVGAPLAYVGELRYPDVVFDAAGVLMELAGGGSLASWQGTRLTEAAGVPG